MLLRLSRINSVLTIQRQCLIRPVQNLSQNLLTLCGMDIVILIYALNKFRSQKITDIKNTQIGSFGFSFGVVCNQSTFQQKKHLGTRFWMMVVWQKILKWEKLQLLLCGLWLAVRNKSKDKNVQTARFGQSCDPRQAIREKKGPLTN